jgi:hypothetical protein
MTTTALQGYIFNPNFVYQKISISFCAKISEDQLKGI